MTLSIANPAEIKLQAWRGFRGHAWRRDIDVAGFIRENVTPYTRDAAFQAGPTPRTTRLWHQMSELFAEERRLGILDADPSIPSTITSHEPGYVDRATELIVGLQTDAPLRRAIMPAGGLRMVANGLAAYGYRLDPAVHETFSGPAGTAREAIQWLYFAYLAATKEQNGAAMSIGRTSTFLDIYLQRDLDEGRLTEDDTQELVDDLVIKLRIIRFLRTPEYDELFSGDPTWVTESIGGMAVDGRTLVTRTSFRYLQTLYNLGPAPEPNLTVLWSGALPDGFKRFCAQVSLDTSAIQYENDDLLRPRFGDDTAIACCVSAMRVGKDMQFFGARVNLAKALLYAINGGRDEVSGAQVAPAAPPLEHGVLDYEAVLAAFDRMLDWLAATYVDALNIIHCMHDKHAYERLEMALHGFHTALDTADFGGEHARRGLLEHTDLVLLDVKSWDRPTFRRVTGVDIDSTQRFAQQVAAFGIPIWLRFVLVPGLTDDPANVEGVARFATSLGVVERIDVLPYHRLGVSKYAQLGLRYPLLLTRVRQQFAATGLPVV